MKISVLSENVSTNPNIKNEHGLSLFIELGDTNILFDMGQSNLFKATAAILNKNLAAVDIAILSHGHYDHGGGLETFFQENKTAPVYISKYAFGEYYNASQKYIGLDKTLKSNPRIVYTDDATPTEIPTSKGSARLTLFSCNDKKRPNSLGAFGLTEKIGDEYTPDRFLHEQYLLIEENNRKILISGCSHKGIIDIVSWFKPDILVGGFHFSKLELGKKLQEAAVKLASYNTTYYTCHCTGVEQYEFMKKHINKLHYISCGEVLEI